MAQLLFFDQGHRYTVDGQELPSVSQLCRFLSREVYGDVNQYTMDAAAARGTAVHKATEVLDLYGKVDVDDDILPYSDHVLHALPAQEAPFPLAFKTEMAIRLVAVPSVIFIIAAALAAFSVFALDRTGITVITAIPF